MKKIKLEIELEFEDDVLTDRDIKIITRNVAEALLHEIGTKGIVPDDCETYTTIVLVKSDNGTFKAIPSINSIKEV